MIDEYIYHIDGDTPTFYVNEFTTDSICRVESYKLYLPGSEQYEDNVIAEGIDLGTGIIEFQMDETGHENVTFVLVVTAMGGGQYIKEENVFVTQC